MELSNMEIAVIIGGIVLGILYRNRDVQTGAVRLPAWVWNVIGVFLLIMVIRHSKDVIAFVFHEADIWWPKILSTAKDLSASLGKLFDAMKEGGK